MASAFNKITHSPATARFNTINRDLLPRPGEWFEQPAVVYENNHATVPARMMYAWNLLVGRPRTAGGNPATGFQANIVSITRATSGFHRPRARASGSITAHSTPTTRSTISPSSTGANSCLDGPNKREWEDFYVGNVKL